jgi:uncharacterized cupredoxin-like copper-binding protein
MKATTLFAAAALVCGTAAFAQQQDNTARTENSASADSIKPADDAQRTKDAARNLGRKARNAMHRAGDKIRDVAKNDKDAHHDRHARVDNDRHHDRHARADHDRMHDRHARAHRHDDDTRAMGAPGSAMRDHEMSRRERMDAAYENWKARQKNG